MWELDCEESWALKNWCFWTVVLEKTLESPLDCKEIQSVHSKGDWSWVFFGRNDAKAETPILWPPHAKSWLIGKDSDTGRDWGQEEKGSTEDEMAGWYLWLNGPEFGWTPGVGDGQGGLASCNSWGCKESDTTERLNWTELNWLPDPWSTRDFSSSLCGWELRRAAWGTGCSWLQAWAAGIPAHAFWQQEFFFLLTYWQGANYCLLWSSYKFLSCFCNLTVSDETIQILAWKTHTADKCRALPSWRKSHLLIFISH